MQGGNHDFGADGKLLVCDPTGTYLVDVGCVLTLLSTLTLRSMRNHANIRFGNRWPCYHHTQCMHQYFTLCKTSLVACLALPGAPQASL